MVGLIGVIVWLYGEIGGDIGNGCFLFCLFVVFVLLLVEGFVVV